MSQRRLINDTLVEPYGIHAVGCDESQSVAEWRTRPEVAARAGLSTKRIQQLEANAIRALRWPPERRRKA